MWVGHLLNVIYLIKSVCVLWWWLYTKVYNENYCSNSAPYSLWCSVCSAASVFLTGSWEQLLCSWLRSFCVPDWEQKITQGIFGKVIIGYTLKGIELRGAEPWITIGLQWVIDISQAAMLKGGNMASKQRHKWVHECVEVCVLPLCECRGACVFPFCVYVCVCAVTSF